MYVKSCKFCKIEFETKNKNGIFCSVICKSQNKSIESKVSKTCPNCNKEYLSCKHSTQKYCSKICGDDNRKKRIREERNCLSCNKLFTTKINSLAKYCSKICYGTDVRGKERNVIDSKKIKGNCKYCSKEYYSWNYRKNHHFCSNKCWNDSRRTPNNCLECGIKYNMPNWHKNKQITPLCNKCIKKSKYKRPLRKSYFELNVISLLKEKLGKDKVIDYFKLKHDNKIFFPDIIIGQNIIECQGDYWHCNPIKFNHNYFHKLKHMNAQQIWDYDKNKKEKFNELGYNVIYIWEYEFFIDKEKSINNLIKQLI